jgi:hypothetical protein
MLMKIAKIESGTDFFPPLRQVPLDTFFVLDSYLNLLFDQSYFSVMQVGQT